MAVQRLTPVVATAVLLLAGCDPGRVRDGLVTAWDRGTGKMIQAARGRGDKMLKAVEATAQAEGCDGKRLPFVRLVSSEIHPTRIRGGEKFHHRFVYALCPRANGRDVTGRLTKRIRHDGKTIHTAAQAGYRLRPGTWADDDEIEVPAGAPSGAYSVDIVLGVGRKRSEVSSDFRVD